MTRFMRDRSMLTPPCTASRWPSSDEPTPNGITGTACAVGELHDDGHVLGALAEDHRLGRRHVERRFVAAMLLAHRHRGRAAIAEAGLQRRQHLRRTARGSMRAGGGREGERSWPVSWSAEGRRGIVGSPAPPLAPCHALLAWPDHGQPPDADRDAHRRRRHDRPRRRQPRAEEPPARRRDRRRRRAEFVARRAAGRAAARRRARAAGR